MMNKTQAETEAFEEALNKLIAKSRSDHLMNAALIGVLYMAISDVDKQASYLPVDGDELHRVIFEGE